MAQIVLDVPFELAEKLQQFNHTALTELLLSTLQHYDGGMVGMAHQISSLAEREQLTLWQEVAKLNFQQGLMALAQQYQTRLQQQGDLHDSIEQLLAELAQTRMRIALDDYSG